jgi:hypothetical protein
MRGICVILFGLDHGFSILVSLSLGDFLLARWIDASIGGPRNFFRPFFLSSLERGKPFKV